MCGTELTGEPNYCGECGHSVKSGGPIQSPASGSAASLGDDLIAREGALRPPTGFGRTLSTELVARQMELRALVKLGSLVESRTYRSGETVIQKGETNRDLFFVTEGVVEVTRQEGGTDLVLNEIEPPYILGEIAFLFGMPRTATVRAKTEVKMFVLKYEDLKELLKDFPPWLSPLLTSLANDIKRLHQKAQMSQKRVSELEEQDRRHV
jgi:CRP-like cAMP-binding protein